MLLKPLGLRTHTVLLREYRSYTQMLNQSLYFSFVPFIFTNDCSHWILRSTITVCCSLPDDCMLTVTERSIRVQTPKPLVNPVLFSTNPRPPTVVICLKAPAVDSPHRTVSCTVEYVRIRLQWRDTVFPSSFFSPVQSADLTSYFLLLWT